MTQQNHIQQAVQRKKALFIDASHQISARPELQNEEHFAAGLLAGLLETEGFSVRHGIPGHETAFIAQKGTGSPHLVFLAEYDALPEIGHGCGHNVIGALSCLAAVAVAEAITQGTVSVYGTPAEEGGDGGSAKASFVAQGLFDTVDAAMMLHPSTKNQTSYPSLAVNCYAFEFFGKTAHAASCPQDGKNALDAMILFFTGINALRQQTTTDTRIHGIITDGGTAPNVIPGYTKAKFFVRANSIEHCNHVQKQVEEIAEGAARMTGCTTAYAPFNNTIEEMLLTPAFDTLFYEKANALGISYEWSDDIPRGSSDVGNVSRVVPTIQPGISVAEHPIPGHTTEFRDACVSPEGDNALVQGAELLAVTALELFTSPEALETVVRSHRKAQTEKADKLT